MTSSLIELTLFQESFTYRILQDSLFTGLALYASSIVTLLDSENAGVTKRSTVADSRSVRADVQGFESLLPH